MITQKMRIKSLLPALLLSLFVVVLTGCTEPPKHSGDIMLRTELFFGLSKPDGGEIAPAEWQAFVDTCVTHQFAKGFTELGGRGQWENNKGGIVRENSKVIIVIHPDTEDANRRVEVVRETYERAFKQEFVLRATAPVKASF